MVIFDNQQEFFSSSWLFQTDFPPIWWMSTQTSKSGHQLLFSCLEVSNSSHMFQGVLQLPECGALNSSHFGKSSHFPALSVFTKTQSSQTLRTKCIIQATQVLLVPASIFPMGLCFREVGPSWTKVLLNLLESYQLVIKRKLFTYF